MMPFPISFLIVLAVYSGFQMSCHLLKSIMLVVVERSKIQKWLPCFIGESKYYHNLNSFIVFGPFAVI